jgi:hypothetical protein
MHHTHKCCKQIWAHLLPIAHPLCQLGEGQPHLKPKNKKRKIKLNVRINILDEGYALHDEGIA